MVFRANRYLLPNLLFERAYMIDSKLSILCVRVLAYPGTIYWPVVLGQHRDWNINSIFFPRYANIEKSVLRWGQVLDDDKLTNIGGPSGSRGTTVCKQCNRRALRVPRNGERVSLETLKSGIDAQVAMAQHWALTGP